MPHNNTVYCSLCIQQGSGTQTEGTSEGGMQDLGYREMRQGPQVTKNNKFWNTDPEMYKRRDAIQRKKSGRVDAISTYTVL